MKLAWITWESQVRNRSMARSVEADLFELKEDRGRFLRYIILMGRTVPILFSKKYQIIFTQNPSIVLSLLSVFTSKITGKMAIVDAHNAGVYPAEGKIWFLTWVNDLVIHYADYVIITNEELAKIISGKGGKPFILPDPIPEISSSLEGRKNNEGEISFLFICSWAEDEPYAEVIEAAKNLPDFKVYITGNYRKKLTGEYIKGLPGNIVLTGYVSDMEYESLLQTVEIVIDLTTRDDCMVCGAYEAAAANTPAIISDHKVNRLYFNLGYIFTKNNRESITIAMRLAVNSIEQLRVDIKTFAINARVDWELRKEKFLRIIELSKS